MGKLKDYFFPAPPPPPEPEPEPEVWMEAEEPEPEPEPEPAPTPIEIVALPEFVPDNPIVFKRDPGGIFPSDAHRRALCVVWWDQHVSSEDILASLDKDEHTPLGSGEPVVLNGILEDLVQSKDITHDENGYIRTDQGHIKLTGPIAEDLV